MKTGIDPKKVKDLIFKQLTKKDQAKLLKLQETTKQPQKKYGFEK